MQGEKEEAEEEKRLKKANKEIEKQIQKDKQVKMTENDGRTDKVSLKVASPY